MRNRKSSFTRNLALFIGLFVLQFACFSQQTINATITHNGIQRGYILYIPANYTGSTSVPLVLNYHGFTSNGNQQMWYGDFRSIADTAGFIIAHPEGTLLAGDTHWNVGGWTTGSTADDVGFTAALIDSLSAIYNINQNKVYSTGMSNGGFMSFLLACELSDRITAIASVSGSMTPETYTACNPQHPMPILQIHGAIDATVPYNGAAWTWSIDNTMQYWVSHNNCSTSPTTIALANTSTNDGSTVEHIIYNGGDNGATAEHMLVTGGAHTWPGTIFGGSGTNYDINASLEIWKFFLRYDLSELTQPVGINELRIEASLFPNPTDDILTIELENESDFSIDVYNLEGRFIHHQSTISGSINLDVTNLKSGLYILQIQADSRVISKKFSRR